MPYRNIILIDDDEDDQEIFSTAVKQISHSIIYTFFFDASEALKALAKMEVAPDVIFLDLNIPVMNGQQFLELIKKNVGLKHIPVIIFTTSSDANTIRTTKELGAHDFITKPDSFDELVNHLKPLFT
ncbi:MAG: response regulator [Chryseolinea sp.]